VNVYDYDLHGTVGRTSAGGTLQARATFPDGNSCATGTLRWKALST
jgi:hypothetical protein